MNLRAYYQVAIYTMKFYLRVCGTIIGDGSSKRNSLFSSL